MERSHLSQFKDGWFIGNFNPSLVETEAFEICVKQFKKGEVELSHFQRISTEITVVLEGTVRMGDHTLEESDILIVSKNEVCDFEALTDCKVMGVKFPSLPNDKVLA